jgi:flagellar protein FliL
MGKDATTEEAPPKTPKTPKTPKKKLIVIVLAAVLLLGGAGGGYLLMKPKSAAAARPAPTPGVVVATDAQTINLADGHYLKVKMSLQMTADAGTDALDGSAARDLAISEYSGMSMGELFSSGYREKTKADLLTKIKKTYAGKIMDLYFTTFVIQ